jgi:hypothetical protein
MFINLTPGDNVIKRFTSVICEKAFVPGKPFQPGPMFAVRPEPTRVKKLSGAPL